VDVGAAAGAEVVAVVVGVVVAVELLLELPHAEASRASVATIKKATGRELAPLIRARRDILALVIRRTVIDRS
jgi:ABC-type transporter Mla maintaining outer membrane lipid asymmetry permease subunit MlaE